MYEWGGAGKLSTWYKVVTWNFFNRLTYFFLVVGHPSPHSWPLKTCFSIIIRFRVYWDEKVRIFFRNVISSLSFTFKIVKIVLVKYSWIIVKISLIGVFCPGYHCICCLVLCGSHTLLLLVKISLQCLCFLLVETIIFVVDCEGGAYKLARCCVIQHSSPCGKTKAE